MTLPALKGGVSSFCKVWILCGSIPQTNKTIPTPNALKGGVWTRLRIKTYLAFIYNIAHKNKKTRFFEK
jgi:hypothetical protein